MKNVILILFCIISLSGCSFFGELFESPALPNSTKPEVAVKPAEVPVVSATPVAQTARPGKPVEVSWQVPNEAVEFYHLYVLNSANEEEKHLKISVRELKKVDDKTYGPIYKYIIPGLTSGGSKSVVIRAENRFGLSPASEPLGMN